MPLLDLFHPPLNRRRHWESLHSAWANALTEHLNHGLLPAGYFAEPHVKVSARVEIDVATFEEEQARQSGGNGGVAVWAPPRPLLDVPLNFQGLDLFEVQVVREEEGPQVVAAIELVSPANKDRPQHRRAFAIKCAAYLQQGIAVMMVDVVTSRRGNLHRELLELLGLAAELAEQLPGDLYAAALRALAGGESLNLQVWAEPLAVEGGLPTLPLWIGADLCLPVNLEETYLAACHTLLLP